MNFLFILAHFDNFCHLPYQKAAQGYLRKESRRFGYRETSCARKKHLSYHARPALISGMDFHQKWTKTKGSRDQIPNTNTQIQIQIHKYEYKFAHTNTNTNTGRAPESNFDILPKNKSFHENGHISGTVGPTSLQHHSNRSSWRARREKHLRGSLTCPGNTGEPEAPVLGCNRHIELGPKAKKWLRQKGQFFGLLCPQTQFCWGRTSKIFDLAPSEPLLDAPFLS